MRHKYYFIKVIHGFLADIRTYGRTEVFHPCGPRPRGPKNSCVGAGGSLGQALAPSGANDTVVLRKLTWHSLRCSCILS